MAEEDATLQSVLAESAKAINAEVLSIPPPTPDSILDDPEPEPEPAAAAPEQETGTSPEPAKPKPPAEGDDYDEEDHVDVAPPKPADKPAEDTTPPDTAALKPWDEDRIREQYKTDEARIKALAETKAYAEKLSAELKAKNAEAATASPAPAATEALPTTEPAIEEPAPLEPLPPAEEKKAVRQAILDIAQEDEQVGSALNHLRSLRTGIANADKTIAAYDNEITKATNVLNHLSHALAYHESELQAHPEDIAIREQVLSIREKRRDARDRLDDLKTQREPIVVARTNNDALFRNGEKILVDLGRSRVYGAREQAQEVQTDSRIQAATITTWETAFTRIADQHGIPKELRRDVSADLAREAMSEIDVPAGKLIPNIEAWLAERLPRRKAFLESVRGRAFTDYAKDKAADVQALQPGPRGDKAKAKPEPEPQPGDLRGELNRSRRMMTEALRGVRPVR